MVTYPSTHGVFEPRIVEICELVHRHGGQVYLDGANMNAQVGLCRPADFGADVSHLNLHKTFCIPHGGGGPGMGPIGVKAHLAPFLPGHPALGRASPGRAGRGRAIRLGLDPADLLCLHPDDGPRRASSRHRGGDPGRQLCRHAGSIRIFRCSTGTATAASRTSASSIRARSRTTCGVTVDDIAKRLIDYGFHAPTMSFPVPGTLMIEPTESEAKVELDRFCDAMLAIRQEIAEIERGRLTVEQSPLRHAPHAAQDLVEEAWERPYRARRRMLSGAASIAANKYWPPVSRIDNVYGDRNLVCSCPPIEDYTQAAE